MAARHEAHKARFIEWLCTPKRERVPQTQGELAQVFGVAENRLSKWKTETEFQRAWENHYLATIGSPERKQTLLDTLFKTGSDADDPRHVQAAAKYMEIVDGLKPQKLEVSFTRPAAELSEDEIDAILARHAENERKLRLVRDEAS